MKTFRVYYNFDIKSHVTDLTIEADRGTFDIQAENDKSIDVEEIKGRIAKIAQDYKTDNSYYVGYSNYYKIEEIKLT